MQKKIPISAKGNTGPTTNNCAMNGIKKTLAIFQKEQYEQAVACDDKGLEFDRIMLLS